MAHDPLVFGAQIGALSKQAGPISETLAFARPDNLLGGAAALMTPTRTLAQQANHDANDGMGRTLANLFVPGVGAYNAYKRMGASMRSPEMKKLQLQQQGRPMPTSPAAPAASMLGEKKSFMVGGTIGALGGLATSKKNKRGLGAGRGALIGGGTELGVYPGAALGGLGGLALGGLISALARRNGAHPGDMIAGGALGAGAGALGGGYLGNIASRALLDDSSHSKQDEKKEKEETKEAGLGKLFKALYHTPRSLKTLAAGGGVGYAAGRNHGHAAGLDAGREDAAKTLTDLLKKKQTKEAFMGAAGKAIASGIGAAGNAIASGARKVLSTNIGNTIASAADEVGQAAFGTPGRAAATAAAGGTAAGVGLGMAEQNRINNQVDYQRQRMAQQPVTPQQPVAPQQPKVAAFLFGAQLGAKVANNPAPTMLPPRLSNAGAAGMQAQNAQQRLGGESYAKFRAGLDGMVGKSVNSMGSPGAGPSVQLTPQMQASRDNLMNEVQFAQQNANKFQGNSQAAFSRIHDLRGTPEYNKTMGKQMAQNGQFDEMAQQAQQQHGINVSPDTLRQSWTQHFSKYGPEGQKPGTLGAAPQTPSHSAIVNEVNAHTGVN